MGVAPPATARSVETPQQYAQRRPATRKRSAYTITTPIERFTEWVDGVLERDQTTLDGNWSCLGGHWLPAGPLDHVFACDAITIGLCREIAETIESRGYCVEPDARFGSGTYDRNQTLALFKPFAGDSIRPSKEYLGAANLLRLCVLIATADGRIDVGELDVFGQAVENLTGLSPTDHKRLIVLEQLLAQELCSASKATARIAKSISANERLLIGMLLVDVAAANHVITQGEHRVLERIFSAFEIPPHTRDGLINEAWSSHPRHEAVHSDISKRDQWLLKHWRTGHPGVVIGDSTLVERRWNFNDWKALNARWRTLHERLNAQQEQSGKRQGARSEEAGKGTRSERTSKRAAPCPLCGWSNCCCATSEPISKRVPTAPQQSFTLDMVRVHAITNETKEVVGILSVLMEDEPEKAAEPPRTVTVPAQEITNVFDDGKVSPQPERFNVLDAAFQPVLVRLLTRDSWPQADFNALAREFHFMPSHIRDTLNEWADEALGDFILDGDDPVIIRLELIPKGMIYG